MFYTHFSFKLSIITIEISKILHYRLYSYKKSIKHTNFNLCTKLLNAFFANLIFLLKNKMF